MVIAHQYVVSTLKERGVIRASPRNPSRRSSAWTPHAQRVLDEKFRGLYFEVIDLNDEGSENIVEAEQVVLDKHDDDVAAITVHLQITAISSTVDVRKPLSKRL